MSRATGPAVAGERPTGAPAASLAVGIFLLAASGLVLEIALTRVLSILYFSPFVYVLLAVAVLGTGIGAAVATLFPATRTRVGAGLASAAGALATPLVCVLLLGLATTPARTLALPLCAVPFVFLGHALATLFALRSRAASPLYLADLSGAGLGALASVPALDLLGPVGTVMAAGALTGLAGLMVAPRTFRAASAAAAAAATLLLAAHLALGTAAPPLASLATAKPLTRELQNGAVEVGHAADALGRSDMVLRPDGSLYLYLDGGAGSLVPDTSDPGSYLHDVGAFAYAVTGAQSVYVIGPGGGLDVALAEAFGVPSITAVELNGAGVRLAESASATGLVKGAPAYAGADLHVDEGRSFLRRQRRRYDLILLSQVVTDAAEARSYALVENGVYTVEAFRDELAHLNPGGAIALKLYDEATLTRALTTAIAALSESGMSQATALHHLVAVLDARGSRPIPLLMVFDHTLSADEATRYGRLAVAAGLQPLYLPGVVENAPLDAFSVGKLRLADLEARSGGVDIRPTRDARPFFFDFEPGLPRPLRQLLVALAAVAVAGAALVWWRQRRRSGPARVAPWLFASLGAGFMLVEVGALQRLRLYLGHPTLTLAVGLAALLVGAGVGAGASARAAGGIRSALRAAAWASLAVAVLGVAWSLAYPAWAHPTLAWPTAARAALAAATLLIVALPMGMPFPLALRAVGEQGEGEVALGWAVNGFVAVLGSTAATAVALSWGFPVVHLAAAGVYLLAAVSAVWMLGLAGATGPVSR